MPWRYVLDIANGIKRLGHDCIILTDNNLTQAKKWVNKDTIVYQIKGRFSFRNNNFTNLVNKIGPDAIYFPVSRKSAISGRLSNVGNILAIAYFPGSWLNLRTIWRTLPKLSFFQAFVYAAESLIPGSLLVKKLKKRKTAGLIALSSYTTGCLIHCGWSASKIKTIPPGLDPIPTAMSYSETFKKHSVYNKSKTSFLYMGPPEKIRGIFCLLKAFDLAADRADDITLACLLRHDSYTEFNGVFKAHASLRHKERIILITDSLNKPNLATFIKASDVVVLPFLLVPSEIPLAVIEALSLGKPLIITESGGTSQFVKEAAMVIPPNNVEALKNAIVNIASRYEMRKKMGLKAKEIASRHPRWEQVSKELFEFTQQMLPTKELHLSQ